METKKRTTIWPEFVALGGRRGTVLRHVGGGKYYRDAGDWAVQAQEEEGKLVVAPSNQHQSVHLVGQFLVATNGLNWKKDNAGYLNHPPEWLKPVLAKVEDKL